MARIIKKSVEEKLVDQHVNDWCEILEENQDELVQLVIDTMYDYDDEVDAEFIYDDVPRLLKQALLIAAKNAF